MSKSFSQIASTMSLMLLALVVLGSVAKAQRPDVEITQPSRITDGILSRYELRQLLNQKTTDRNPLRQRQYQPLPATTIVDQRVSPAAWQQAETPAPAPAQPANPIPQAANPIPQAASPIPQPVSSRPEPALQVVEPYQKPEPVAEPTPQTATASVAEELDQTSSYFGPMPPEEMQTDWQKFDMLLESNVDELKNEITQHRSSIDESVGIDENAKTERLRHLEIADGATQQARQNNSSKADFQNQIREFEDAVARLRAEAKTPPVAAPIDGSVSIEVMQLTLRNLQAELDHEKSIKSKILKRIQQRDERRARIPDERIQSRHEVDELHEELLQKQSIGTEDIEILLSLRARELAASTNVQLLDQEAKWHDISQEKLPLEKSINQRKLQHLEEEITAWNGAIAQRKHTELEQQIIAARNNAYDAHPSLKAFSQETTELARARVELAEKIGALQKEKLKVSKQQDEVHDQFNNLETSLKKIGKEGSGDLLIDVHRTLIRPWEGMARIQVLKTELQHNRGTILKLRSEQESIADPATFIHDQLQITADIPIANTTLVAMAKEAVENHRQHLIALVGDIEDYEDSISEVLPLRKKLVEEIAATRELVDTHALWVQSADPLDVNVLAKSRQGATEFFDHNQWRELGTSVVSHIVRRPWECVLGTIGLIVAFVVGRKFQE